jgi:two-component system sensor histidine kinase KdpD
MNLPPSTGSSQPFSRFRSSLRWLAATAVTVATTGILLMLKADASASGIAYLVLVVWFATIVGPGPSIYLATLCAVAFDYFFLVPFFSFSIAGVRDILSMAAFLIACIVVSRVAERARRQTRQAEQRREDVERLYALSQEMMLHEDAAGLVREIPRLVEKNFALEAVLLYVRDEDQLYSSIPGEVSETIRAELQSAVTRSESETADELSAINLTFGMNSAGTLGWKPAKLSREVATSIAAQVAIAITRANAIEAFTRVEAARSADRLRTALIDSLTHELRTPLTAIRAAATTLVDGRGLDGESRDELAAIVDEESLRLDALIGEAMEIAQIESDGVRVKLAPIHLGTFLEQAVEESHGSLASHRLTITVQPAESVARPDGPVWLDPLLIGRVLRHLLENAARYTPADSRISIHVRRSTDRLEFSVEDDGPGIDAYDLPHVFEKFYRGRKRLSKAKGSGMGLAIVRAILTTHGGGIEAESSVGKGTRFRFWIPLVERAGAADSYQE